MLFIAQLSPLQTGLLPPFQPVTTAELWHLKCWGSKDRVGMARFFWCTKRGLRCFFNVVTVSTLLFHLFKICRWCTMLREKRENRRQTWSYHKETFNIRTSSGCPEQCWFQPIPHLHLPLESDIWMDCTHVQKHLIFLQFSVHLKPSWWIDMNSWPCLDLNHPVPPKSPDQFRQGPLCIWHRDVLMPWAKRRPPLRFPQALSTVLPFWNGLFLKPRASVIGKSRQKHNLYIV